jgi:ubiquinone/menaquinone biosynthesis C-methylase UbiE
VGHPVFARVFERLAPLIDRAGRDAHRDELLEGLVGRVIEVGAGSGLCFTHYPDTVEEVLAVEPEPHLRGVATRAVLTTATSIRVVDGTAEHLPVDDASFDAAVISHVLCSVPDQRVALKEIHRVLRPGGELRFYEHVRSNEPRLSRLQDRLDPIWALVNGGCHPNRDTEAAIGGAGFVIERCRRFEFAPGILAKPSSPQLIGRAVAT